MLSQVKKVKLKGFGDAKETAYREETFLWPYRIFVDYALAAQMGSRMWFLPKSCSIEGSNFLTSTWLN